MPFSYHGQSFYDTFTMSVFLYSAWFTRQLFILMQPFFVKFHGFKTNSSIISKDALLPMLKLATASKLQILIYDIPQSDSLGRVPKSYNWRTLFWMWPTQWKHSTYHCPSTIPCCIFLGNKFVWHFNYFWKWYSGYKISSRRRRARQLLSQGRSKLIPKKIWSKDKWADWQITGSSFCVLGFACVYYKIEGALSTSTLWLIAELVLSIVKLIPWNLLFLHNFVLLLVSLL